MVPESTNLFAGSKVLITGGMGFIGSNLARRLIEQGADVVLVDNLIPEYGGKEVYMDGIKAKCGLIVAYVCEEEPMWVFIQGEDFLFNLSGWTRNLGSNPGP